MTDLPGNFPQLGPKFGRHCGPPGQRAVPIRPVAPEKSGFPPVPNFWRSPMGGSKSPSPAKEQLPSPRPGGPLFCVHFSKAAPTHRPPNTFSPSGEATQGSDSARIALKELRRAPSVPRPEIPGPKPHPSPPEPSPRNRTSRRPHRPPPPDLPARHPPSPSRPPPPPPPPPVSPKDAGTRPERRPMKNAPPSGQPSHIAAGFDRLDMKPAFQPRRWIPEHAWRDARIPRGGSSNASLRHGEKPPFPESQTSGGAVPPSVSEILDEDGFRLSPAPRATCLKERRRFARPP